MKITTRFIYGLKFIEFLYHQKKPQNMIIISKELNLSKKYLEKIVKSFIDSGILKTYKGRKGGYKLSENIKNVTVYDIYEILEGDVKEGKCYQVEDCKILNCQVKLFLDELNDNIINFLKSKKISDLFEKNLT